MASVLQVQESKPDIFPFSEGRVNDINPNSIQSSNCNVKCFDPNSFPFFGDGEHAPTNWVKGIQIGCGGFSEVYVAKIEFREKISMVVKQIKIGLPPKEKKKCEDSARTEICALKKLVHERIVSFYGFCSTNFMFFIFMEHMLAGSLSDYISNHNALCLDLVKHFTRQLLEGVEYLHSQRIIHRDIKPENILLKDDKNIKIADFGISKIFEEVSKAYTSDVGTTRYMAPEMFCDGSYKYPVDIWSCGCVVLEMVTGKSPFPTLDRQRIYSTLMGGNPSPIQNKLPKDVTEFLIKIFKKEPMERPNAKALLSDIFLKDELNFATWNVNEILKTAIDLNATFENIFQILSSLNIDIAFLKVKKLKPQPSFCCEGYTVYFSESKDELQSQGCALVIRNELSIENETIKFLHSERLMKCTLKTNCGFVHFFYLIEYSQSPNDELYQSLEETIQKVPDSEPFYIAVKAGSKWCPQCVGKFGLAHLNTNCHKVFELCAKYELGVTNHCLNFAKGERAASFPKTQNSNDFLLTKKSNMNSVLKTMSYELCLFKTLSSQGFIISKIRLSNTVEYILRF